jgi:hypothetical protein
VVEGDLILERFLIGERVGQGGFGVVHRAWDQSLDRPVAVKEIATGDARRVQREAHAAGRLNHPGIVTLFEFGAERSRTYLISELVEGATLRELIEDRAISDRDVAVVGSELCGALAHAHGRGVVHRDIKPENVIVSEGSLETGRGRGQVKLMDFGIAAIAGAPTLTATGQMLGTLAYIAPEQAEGGRTGPAADVYALAINLYECWSGGNPVARDTPAATVRAIGADIAPLASERPDLPRGATEIVDACLDPEPQNRPTVAELKTTLVEVGDLIDPTRAVPAPVRGSEPADGGLARSAPRITIPAALAGVVALAGLTLIGFGGLALVLATLIVPAVLFVHSRRAWLLGALAPGLALIGLAPLYIVVAATVGRSTSGRVVLGALGIAWLLVAGSLFGLPSPFADLPPASGWADSAGSAAGALGSALSASSVALGVVWALGAASLGVILSLRVVGLRPVLGLVWAAGLVGAYEVVYGTSAGGAPAGGGPVPLALVAAVLGVVVVASLRETPSRRALGGRAGSSSTRFRGLEQRAAQSAHRAPVRIPGRRQDPLVP